MSDMPRIVEKSFWWNFVPLSGRRRFSASIGDTIYLTPKRWRDYKSGSPSRTTRALVAHEMRHYTQRQRVGARLWTRRYLFSRHWRMKYEAEAYAHQILLLGGNRVSWAQKKAKTLARWYLLFMSETVVLCWITHYVDKLDTELGIT